MIDNFIFNLVNTCAKEISGKNKFSVKALECRVEDLLKYFVG